MLTLIDWAGPLIATAATLVALIFEFRTEINNKKRITTAGYVTILLAIAGLATTLIVRRKSNIEFNKLSTTANDIKNQNSKLLRSDSLKSSEIDSLKDCVIDLKDQIIANTTAKLNYEIKLRYENQRIILNNLITELNSNSKYLKELGNLQSWKDSNNFMNGTLSFDALDKAFFALSFKEGDRDLIKLLIEQLKNANQSIKLIFESPAGKRLTNLNSLDRQRDRIYHNSNKLKDRIIAYLKTWPNS